MIQSIRALAVQLQGKIPAALKAPLTQAVQLRRFSLPALQGGGKSSEGEQAVDALVKSRRASVAEGDARGPWTKEKICVTAGSQGLGFLWGMILSKQKGHHNKDLVLLARDTKKAESEAFVDVERPDGRGVERHALAPHLHDIASVVPSAPGSAVWVTQSSSALVDYWLPKMRAGGVPDSNPLLASYNGVPPARPEDDPAHAISKMPTGQSADRKASVISGAPSLEVEQGSWWEATLKGAMRENGVIDVQGVPSAKAAQWRKLAMNNSLNTMAAVFNTDMAGLTRMMGSDPRVDSLMRGLVRETAALARKMHDVEIPEADVVKSNRAFMGNAPGFRTSMGRDFRNGVETEVDVISGGVATLSAGLKLKAPLCHAMTLALRTLEGVRGKGQPVTDDFDGRVLAQHPRLYEDLLDLAAAQEAAEPPVVA